MNTISVSQLKVNPSKAILASEDFPVAIAKRNSVKAYLLGKNLYEKLVATIEDYVDERAIRSTDFSKGKSFDKVAQELGL